MSTFYRCSNNGTIAVVSKETYEQIQAWNGLADEARAIQPYPRPIFTFVRPEHYAAGHYREFVTGDYTLMDELLKGHLCKVAGFSVPFSNGFELNEGQDGPERRFRTTLRQAMKAFGLVVKEIREPVI